MNIFSDTLTVLGGGAGILMLLVMAALPLLVDAESRRMPAEVRERPAPRPPVAHLPAQRGAAEGLAPVRTVVIPAQRSLAGIHS